MPNHPQKRAPGNFEAISFNPRKGTFLRTRHHSYEKAWNRLEGNRRHERKQVIDHTPQKEVKK